MRRNLFTKYPHNLKTTSKGNRLLAQSQVFAETVLKNACIKMNSCFTPVYVRFVVFIAIFSCYCVLKIVPIPEKNIFFLKLHMYISRKFINFKKNTTFLKSLFKLRMKKTEMIPLSNKNTGLLNVKCNSYMYCLYIFFLLIVLLFKYIGSAG